jgi:hypothetical protein
MKRRFYATAVAAAVLFLDLQPTQAGQVHIFTTYSDDIAPGFTFPNGPDENVRLVITCPGSAVSQLALTMPAGASLSTFGGSSLAAPLYQDVSVMLTQDYPVSPTRIMFKVTLSTIGVSGFIGPNDDQSANFWGPDCVKPWHLELTSGPITGAYSPNTDRGLSPGQTPFPAEQ